MPSLLLRDAGDDAEHVVQLDLIAGFEVPRDRFWPDSREAHLPLRIVRIDEVHVQRDLPVNAHGLNLRDLTVRVPFSMIAPRLDPILRQLPAPGLGNPDPHQRGERETPATRSTAPAPKPWVCASVPTVNGAAALTMRPTL